jgi:[acyl-carrier-protein] S-malonyltransferase
MYAIIGVDDAAIIAACADAESKLNQVVSAVNFNSPGQVVIAGAKDAADLAAELCKEAGAKRALPLAVSVPSHCALMKPAAEQLAAMLENIQFSEPQIPVINNVDVKSPSSAKEIKDALVRQLYCPVRWTETVQLLASHGVDKMFEIGPGKVLTGLVKRIDKHVSGEAVNTSDGVASLSN